MQRVDFYILAEADPQARLKLACRLTEKAWSQGQRVCLLAASPEEAQTLDLQLWTFRDRSFIPHEIAAAGVQSPVLIATALNPDLPGEVLINLGDAVPEGYERFARIVETIDGDPQRRRHGRERFRFYRDRGLTPQSHNVSLNHEF